MAGLDASSGRADSQQNTLQIVTEGSVISPGNLSRFQDHTNPELLHAQGAVYSRFFSAGNDHISGILSGSSFQMSFRSFLPLMGYVANPCRVGV